MTSKKIIGPGCHIVCAYNYCTCLNVQISSQIYRRLFVIFYPPWIYHGQTSANRTKRGPSFHFQKWPFACCTILVLSVKLSNLKLKTRPKQLLGSLPLVITHPDIPKTAVRYSNEVCLKNPLFRDLQNSVAKRFFVFFATQISMFNYKKPKQSRCHFFRRSYD